MWGFRLVAPKVLKFPIPESDFSYPACASQRADSKEAEEMNTKLSVRLIKKKDRKGPGPQAEVESAVDPNRWSTAVRSWVIEFQQDRRGESLPAFDSLFKVALELPGGQAKLQT